MTITDNERPGSTTLPNKEAPEAPFRELSLADQRALAAAILDPPDPNPALQQAADAYRRLVMLTMTREPGSKSGR